MTVYVSDQHLYACVGELFRRIGKEHPAAEESVLDAGLVINFRCTQPDALVTIDGRERPLQITYGTAARKPDLDIEISADALHQILLGDLKLAKAVGSRQLKPKGPIWKVFVLEPIFTTAQTVYPQVIQECGG